MRIELNGKDVELPAGASLGDAVREAGAVPEESPRGVAVALDGEVVPRVEWASTALAEGSRVEVLAISTTPLGSWGAGGGPRG
jgi:sulfur carrier protein